MTHFAPGPISGHTPRTEQASVPRPVRFPAVSEPDPNWRDRAACFGMDPETWFPVNDAEYGPALLQAHDAISVCNRCDAVDACLRWALDTGQDTGVWGGLTAPDRVRLKRRTAKAAMRGKQAAA